MFGRGIIRTNRMALFFSSVKAVLLAAAFSTSLNAQLGADVSVTTWHNDNGRTGQNINETILLYNQLSKYNFGKLCSLSLDAQVYAQPLIVRNVTINTIQQRCGFPNGETG